MGADITIPLGSMEELDSALKATIAEFEDAGKNQDAVENAIGSPCGKSDLRGAASAFESDWDDKRDKLKDDLSELKKHLDDVKNGWQKLDHDLAKTLEQQK